MECINKKENEKGNRNIGEGRESFYRQNGFSSEGIKLLKERNIEIIEITRKNERERVGQWIKEELGNQNIT